jgi:hypothetical protein
MGTPYTTQSDFGFASQAQLDGRVFDPHAEAVQQFTRTGIANEFLSITATEPIFQVAIDTTTVEPPEALNRKGNEGD